MVPGVPANRYTAIHTVIYRPPHDRRRRRLALRIVGLSLLGVAPVVFAIFRARAECSIDVQCISADQWLLRRRRDSASMRRKNETTTLLIVAHPGDQEIWAEELLMRNGKDIHVMITSTRTGGSEATTKDPSDKVRLSSDEHKFSGEYLWGIDKFRDQFHFNPSPSSVLEKSIKSRIRARVCDRPWQSIITHGYEGEYGDLQHSAVHDAVLEAVHYCCNTTQRLKVFEFDPGPSLLLDQSDESKQGKIYRKRIKRNNKVNQSISEHRLFKDWIEAGAVVRYVPYSQYDPILATKACSALRKRWGDDSDSACRAVIEDENSDDSSDYLFRPKEESLSSQGNVLIVIYYIYLNIS